MKSVMDHVNTVTDKSLVETPAAQVNAVGDQLLGEKDKVNHLQRIGGGGYGGTFDSERSERKKTNSLLGNAVSLLTEIRDKRQASIGGGELVFGK